MSRSEDREAAAGEELYKPTRTVSDYQILLPMPAVMKEAELRQSEKVAEFDCVGESLSG